MWPTFLGSISSEFTINYLPLPVKCSSKRGNYEFLSVINLIHWHLKLVPLNYNPTEVLDGACSSVCLKRLLMKIKYCWRRLMEQTSQSKSCWRMDTENVEVKEGTQKADPKESWPWSYTRSILIQPHCRPSQGRSLVSILIPQVLTPDQTPALTALLLCTTSLFGLLSSVSQRGIFKVLLYVKLKVCLPNGCRQRMEERGHLS